MLKLILSLFAIYLVVRMFQQKLAEKNNSLKKDNEGGRIIEGEVVNDEDDNESKKGDN